MAYFKCVVCKHHYTPSDSPPCDNCEYIGDGRYSAYSPCTNADRIRAMTDEELAKYLFERGNEDEYCYGICVHQDDVNACAKARKQDGCIQSVVAWLKQEIKTN